MSERQRYKSARTDISDLIVHMTLAYVNSARFLRNYHMVLSYLAMNAPTTKYRIEKELNKSRPRIRHATLHKVISDLKASASIEVVKTDTSRVGLTMEYYDLKLIGLLGAIQADSIHTLRKDTAQRISHVFDLDSIADKYSPCLPLILGKWRFFKEKGWNPHKQLRTSAGEIVRWEEWFKWIEIYRRGSPRCTGATDFFVTEYAYPIATEPNTQHAKKALTHSESAFREALYSHFFNPALDRIWKQDPEIRNWISDEITSKVTWHMEQAKSFEKRKKEIES